MKRDLILLAVFTAGGLAVLWGLGWLLGWTQ